VFRLTTTKLWWKINQERFKIEAGRVKGSLSKRWTSDEVELDFEHGQSWNWPRVFGTIISEQLRATGYLKYTPMPPDSCISAWLC
jgi:hypothetical protein